MTVSRSLMITAAVLMLGVTPAIAQDAPAAEAAAPAQDAPKAETPKAETSATEAPKTDAPKAADAPKTDAVKTEAAPKTDKPATTDTAEKPAPKKAAKKDDVIGNPKAEDGNPVQTWIAAENKLIDTLSPKDQETFFVMRNKHGVIRAIRVVDRDINNAVQACGKKNPGMKNDMDARFKQWQNAVLPTIDLAEKFLKEEIETQKVVFPSDFKYVLKLNDKAYEYGESRIEKQPVTSEDACEDLLDSMDRTENDMVEMLQDMLLPESVIRDRAARAKEAEEADKARKASE